VPDYNRTWRGTTPEDRVVELPQLLPDTDDPIYVRLAQVLSEARAAGLLPAHERLPKFGALARRYGCSAPTAQRAIAHLVTIGLVRKNSAGRAYWVP
jgi:DNA-binding GntR family transcriptional regulator